MVQVQVQVTANVMAKVSSLEKWVVTSIYSQTARCWHAVYRVKASPIYGQVFIKWDLWKDRILMTVVEGQDNLPHCAEVAAHIRPGSEQASMARHDCAECQTIIRSCGAPSLKAAISSMLPRNLNQATSLGHQLPAFCFDTNHTCPDLSGKVFIIYALHGVFLHG